MRMKSTENKISLLLVTVLYPVVNWNVELFYEFRVSMIKDSIPFQIHVGDVDV
jgi:hypothetical protein